MRSTAINNDVSTALYIIESPLQLLCAREALSELNQNGRNILLLLHNNRGSTRHQLEVLIDYKEWQSILEISIKNSWHLYTNLFWLFIRNLRTIKFNKVFIGDYVCPYMVFLAVNLRAKIYILDDGISTLAFGKAFFGKMTLRKFFKTTILKLLFLKEKLKEDEVTVFSFFKKPSDYRGTWITHNFNIIRRDLPTKLRDQSIWVLGQDLIESGYVDQTSYYNLLEEISHHNPGRRIIYIPHRKEDKLALENVCAKLNWELMRINLPIELEMVQMQTHPQKILSFISTALFTIKALFPMTEVAYIRIPTNTLRKNQDYISYLYSVLSTQVPQADWT